MTPILFIHGITAIGGAERDLLIILSGLDRARYHPIVVLPGHGPLVKDIQKLGIKTIISMLPPWRKPKYYFLRLPAIIHLYRILIKEKIKLIIVNDMWWVPLCYISGRLAGIPVAAFLRQELEQERVSQYWLRKPEMLLPVSNSIKNTLLNCGIDSSRLHTIYSGVEINETASDDVIKKENLNLSFPVIGTIANIFPRKGLEYLIRAVHLIKPDFPDIQCLIIGSGDQRYLNKLQAIVKELDLGGNIKFLGYQENVKSYLSSFDLFVLPSVMEGFGIVLLEAMSMKKAIVASRVGGIPEIVLDGETGLLVPPGNPDALSQAILLVLKDKALRDKFGMAGFERVYQDFSRKKMIAEISAVYDQLTHQGSV